MKVTITRLRQDLFRLVERALDGETIEFTYKGTVFRLAPEAPPSKLARLTSERILAPNADLGAARRELLKEMEAEWERDWSEL